MTIQIELTSPLQDEIIQLTQALVRQNSLPGQEQAVAEIVETKLHAMDFDEVFVDEYGNVVGIRVGAQTGARVLFDAHMDVVPANDLKEWTVDPYGGELIDGKIWGRGSTDIKGGLAAMLVSLGRLPHQALPGTLILSASVGEETIEGVALKNVIDRTHPDGVVVVEPTQCKLGIGQKGRLGFRVNVTGKPAHTSTPELGENAIYKAVEVIQLLRKMQLPVDSFLGKGIMDLIEISSTPFPGTSIVPYGCSLRFERRLMSNETLATVRKAIDRALIDLDGWQMEINETEYTAYTGRVVRYQEFHPGWHMDHASPWVQKAVAGLKSAHLKAEFTALPYCTNASYPAGILNMPTVVFGPSTIKLAHGIDEYIEVDELIQAARGMMGLAASLGESTSG